MNKIEQELDSLIDTKRYSCSNQKENEGYKQGVQDSYSLLEKHSIGFAKWLSENYSTSVRTPNQWLHKYGGSYISTTEAFKLYIEQL